ncbi:hypothetical protein Pfo_027691 [Paulownia fortunei]|nr:hypothetical protein Pfo_027691 [Paulownia fortunei]
MKLKIKVSKTADDEAQSSAQVIASIDDLLTEIFLRLPMKSLIRFKLVSKHSHSLISDREHSVFCAILIPIPLLASSLLSIKLNFTKDPSGISILHSCDGLLLCSNFRADDQNRRYYVCNPTTNKFSTLPKLDGGGGIWTRILGMSLAFDPAKSPHYKVVCVRGLGIDLGEYQSQVDFENGVYWNGSIHWIRKRNKHSLYFNPDDHQMPPQIMPMPPFPDSLDWRSNYYYFGESCDRLHYIEISRPQIQFNVYEMKRDYSEWFVKYQVDLSPVVACFDQLDSYYFWHYYVFSIFTLVRGEKEEDSFLVLQIPGKAVQYNLVCTTFETLYEFKEGMAIGPSGFRYAKFQYIESLCCV